MGKPEIKILIERILNSPKTDFLLKLYVRFWNPVNYAIVGAIGVFINYVVWLALLAWTSWLPWFMINGLAILTAWSWNWLNSVGPAGYLWGFAHENKHNRT